MTSKRASAYASHNQS